MFIILNGMIAKSLVVGKLLSGLNVFNINLIIDGAEASFKAISSETIFESCDIFINTLCQ